VNIMAVSLPTSADVRKVRAEATKAVNAQIDFVKTPLLAWLGAGDLAVNKVNDAVAKARTRGAERRDAARARAEKLQSQLSDLPEKLTTEELRKRYTELADRGEDTLERIRRQPRVAKAIETVEDANRRVEKRVEKAVDDVHDVGEEVLGRVSTETRSVGERAARATQRFSSEAADTVTKVSAEVAEEVEEAGDEAASATRSASRKAANRTAPAKSTSNNTTRNTK
jgi:heparin binding hemagglutinin HbhA